ncbi:hypothetical protein OGAPHI_000591 [Ogataea philodendri]|uniref:Uncharacterized protein n=1 Tax=Ogataea philodendri TaxID=1378263 RepID=A0A9P8TA16_9ASCO|nr:uncharacterized protein OGAPHI_000591 [Ogataea philodendri]KAH3670880.1 hypothetical protein OGAPHI_000591 [Ogataea philodendri]
MLLVLRVIQLVRSRCSVDHFSEVSVENVAEVFPNGLEVDCNKSHGWFGEKVVDFFQRSALGLHHEKQLVDPSQSSDSSVESQSQSSVGERVPHIGEVVGDDEGPQVQRGTGHGNTVRTQVCWEHLGWNNPGQTRVRAEEAHVQDDTGQVQSERRRAVDRQSVRDTNKHQSDEESWKHSIGPEPASTVVHAHDGWNGTEKQSTSSNKRHEHRVLLVESNGSHQGRHVVHDSVDTGELSKENHHCGLFLFQRLDHVQELDLGVNVLDVSKTFPDSVCGSKSSLVDKVSWGLWKEEHTGKQQGGEHERRTQNVSPGTVQRIEHGSNSVSENFSKSNIELEQGNQVSSHFGWRTLTNVGRDDGFQTNTKSNKETTGIQTFNIWSSSTQNTSNSVRNTSNHNRQSSSQKLVQWRKTDTSTNSTQRHQSTHKRLLVRGNIEIWNKRHLGTGNERLVNTRKHASQRGKEGKHVNHVFSLAKVDGVASSQHHTVPQGVCIFCFFCEEFQLLKTSSELQALVVKGLSLS